MIITISKMNTIIRNFWRGSSGIVTIEFVMMFPFMGVILLAIMVYFDAYHIKSLNLKAAYTVSDMLSRQTVAIDQDYIVGLHNLFKFVATSPEASSINVTLIQYDEKDPADPDDNVHILIWSHGSAGTTEHDVTSIAALADSIPIMAHGARALIVETEMEYVPPMDVGLKPFVITNFIVTRPRWGSGPCWESCI